MANIKIYVDTPAWFVRPGNSDWQYIRSLKRLEDFIPVRMHYPFDFQDILGENLHYIRIRGQGFAEWGANTLPRASDFQRTIPRKALSESRADVVLNHGRYPLNAGPLPVVWQHAVVDPAMQMHRGFSAGHIEAQYEAQAESYKKAAVVHVCTDAEAERHAMKFPEIADRFMSAPLFLPRTNAISLGDLREKHGNDGELRLLFVGRDARRKGLDLLVAALRLLGEDVCSRLVVDVVTSLADGPVEMNVPFIRYHRSLPNTEVLQLMKEAHIFVMPSRFESFGIVFLEAMASGCAVILPDWEVQREISDNGKAGMNVSPDYESIRSALETLCTDRTCRLNLAEQALERYLSHFSPEMVARRYMRLFEHAVSAS